MNRVAHRAACTIFLIASSLSAQAQLTEFARATLQNEGSTSGQGVTVSSTFYTGWRFQVTDGPLITTDIGAHFSGNGGATLFGAIVRLTGPQDSPDRFDLTSSDVLTTTVFNGPAGSASQEISTPLNIELQNGWYLVIFGAGAFGASSNGGGMRGQDISSAIPGAQNIITSRQASHPLGELGPIAQALVTRIFVHAQPPSSCSADFNGDDILDFFDYLDFVAAFAAQEPVADFNNDIVIDFFDYLDFVQAFSTGC